MLNREIEIHCMWVRFICAPNETYKKCQSTISRVYRDGVAVVTKVKKILAAFACGTLAQQGYAVGFLDDSKASISSRTLYYDGDQRSTGGVDQRQTLTGLRLDFQSGYTQGAVGLGLDLQALAGFNLNGGSSPHDVSTVNTVSPVKTDGSPVDNWSRIGGNARFKYSKTEVKAGNALAFNLPVLISKRRSPVVCKFPRGCSDV